MARRRGMVELAVARDIEALPERVRGSGLALTAVTLARVVDMLNSTGQPGYSRDLAAISKELRATLTELAKSGAPGAKGGKVDDLQRRRAARRNAAG
jgi:hypothetical protein